MASVMNVEQTQTQAQSLPISGPGTLFQQPFRVTYNGHMIFHDVKYLLPPQTEEMLSKYPELGLTFNFQKKNGKKPYYELKPVVPNNFTVKKVVFRIQYHIPVQHPDYDGLLRLKKHCTPEQEEAAEEEARNILRVFDYMQKLIASELNLASNVGSEDTSFSSFQYFSTKSLEEIWQISLLKPNQNYQKGEKFSLNEYMITTGDILLEIAYGYEKPGIGENSKNLVGVNFSLCQKKDKGPSESAVSRTRNPKRSLESPTGKDFKRFGDYMGLFNKNYDQGMDVKGNMLDVLRTFSMTAKGMMAQMEAEVMRRTVEYNKTRPPIPEPAVDVSMTA